LIIAHKLSQDQEVSKLANENKDLAMRAEQQAERLQAEQLRYKRLEEDLAISTERQSK
jgi:hypothetical protein